MGFIKGVKSVVFLFFLLGSLFCLAPAAQAHFITTDGSVLIMLHASDDDDPIIGQPADLTFYITDSQKKFKAAECDCRLEISLNGQIVLSTTTFENIKNNAIFSYTFPQKGIYTVKFTAKPLADKDFQNFAFNYDLRVDRTMEQALADKASLSRSRIYLILGVVILLIIFFNYKKLKKGILGLLILLLVAGPVIHLSQVLCPDHTHGNQTSQHQCCFVPLVENSPNLSVNWLPALSETKTVRLQQAGKVKIIFSLNNKSPPNRMV